MQVKQIGFCLIIKMLVFLSIFLSIQNIYAKNITVNFVINYKTVNFAGKSIQALAINNQIPGPTLHFKQGDTVTINVYNQLKENTALHWHGLIIPWQMDGVEHITQKPIPPGGMFRYHFTLYQSGTYWYHAHAGLQEQRGLYGALIIDPLKPPAYKYNKDYVVVLSDWSNTNPNQILKNLKKDGDYYEPNFPLQPSLVHFIQDYQKASLQERQLLLADYKMMQSMRMSIYDYSDVAYDAFLLNGHPSSQPWTAPVKIGDVVRLRFIGAAGSTIYHVKIPGTIMQVVHVEGNDVRPYAVNDFTIAPGETYDVLIKIQNNMPYIIYAESTDTVGAAIGALTTSPQQSIDFKQVKPFPEPLPVTRTMMANMMGGMTNMNMNKNMTMDMPTEPSIIGDKICPPNSYTATTMGTKYQNLVAAVKTNNPNKPIAGVIGMELFGYMNNYIWMINGESESQAKPIIIQAGKRYRIIFTNNSMMDHPMHMHGHWFILRNGHGAYDPLLHTIVVPPGATVVVDFDADESGQWFFHCHLLYHMMSGMSRVFQYSSIIAVANGQAQPQSYINQGKYQNQPIIREDEIMPIDPMMVDHAMGHPSGNYFSNYLDLGEDPFDNAQRITFKGLYGGDYNKLELFTNDAEANDGRLDNADMDIFYWHLISQFWAIKGGMNYTYRPAADPYLQPGIGIEGLMPYFIDTDIRAYYNDGSAKLDAELSRDTQITNNFFIRLGIRSILATDTVTEDDIGSGLNQMRYTIRPYYRIQPGLAVFAEYEHDQDYGAFKNIVENMGESATDNTVTLGVMLLF